MLTKEEFERLIVNLELSCLAPGRPKAKFFVVVCIWESATSEAHTFEWVGKISPAGYLMAMFI